MAQIDVESLLKTYEDEIGRLNGIILRERASHVASLQEMQEVLVAVQAELTALQKERATLEAVPNPAPDPVAEPKLVEEFPRTPKRRSPKSG